MKDIDFGKIIKRSWYLTWNNKWLWVTGLVLAVFAGGGSGSGGGGGSSSSQSGVPNATETPQPVIDEIKRQTDSVLGEATNVMSNWFSNIPTQNWVFFFLALLAFIIFTVAAVWIVTSWAKGALIWGLNDADDEKIVDLKSISPKGISKIKDLILFNLISTGITFALVFGLTLIVGLGFLIKLALPVLGIIWLILFGIVGVLAFVVAIVLFIMLSVYAERLIVLKDYSPWEAWKKGLVLGKSNFIPTLSMGIINSAIGCGAGCLSLIALLIVFGIPAYLLISPIFKDGFSVPNISQIIGIIIIIILFFSINTLVRAVLMVFNYGNWNLFFKQIFTESKNEK